MKSPTILLLSVLFLASCSSQTPNSDTAEIILAFNTHYQNSSLEIVGAKQFYYIDKIVGNEFNKRCIGSLDDHKMRVIKRDSLCQLYKQGKLPQWQYDPCLGLENNIDFREYFNREEWDELSFDRNEPIELDKELQLKDEFEIVDFSRPDEIPNFGKVIKLHGPFFNQKKNQALLIWLTSDIGGIDGSSNCLFLKKTPDGKWEALGNGNFGL